MANFTDKDLEKDDKIRIRRSAEQNKIIANHHKIQAEQRAIINQPFSEIKSILNSKTQE